MCRTGLLALVVCFLLSTWQKESGMSADPPREPSELAKWLRREKNLRSDICKVLQGKQFFHLVPIREMMHANFEWMNLKILVTSFGHQNS